METLALNTLPRTQSERLKSIRADRKIPAVVYGHHFGSMSVTVDMSEFVKTFRRAGQTHLVDLMIDGKAQKVLIYELQRHPVTGDVLHVDFLAVSAKEKITVDIPLVLIGESPAVRAGAILEQHIDTIEVRCLPGDLVDDFKVDISILKEVDDVLHVSAVQIDTKKFDIITSLSEGIATVSAPHDYVAEEAARAEADAAAAVARAAEEAKAATEAAADEK